MSILQDQRFTSLDITMQRIIEPYIIEIHKKLDEVIVSQNSAPWTIWQAGGHKCICSDDYLTAELDRRIQSTILHSLQFPTMTHRQLEIAEAHQRTFSWLFHQSNEDEPCCNTSKYDGRPWSNFVQWLRTGSGVYWINGKPGSGKSTLMRFISENPETQSHLEFWSQNAEIQVLPFYFWNSGSELQRSQSGLLRSVLFDILHYRPELTCLLLPEQWAKVDRSQSQYCHAARCPEGSGKPKIPEWNFHLRDLERAFLGLSNLATDQFKLCFIIDGLDEYEGDGEQLAELFKQITKSPFIKVCLSSRPWMEFEEAFQDSPGLRLQDLTYEDIQFYVRDNLQTNQKMQKLNKSNPSGAALLIKGIVMKANGVFLWVRLATRSLLAGLRNQDSIADLQNRLDELPSDLNLLYDHIIARINPLYIEQASRIFQIYDAISTLGLKPSILELELAVSASRFEAISSPAKVMIEQEIEDRCEKMTAHLKSRCVDLLEIHDHWDANWESVDDDVESSEIVYHGNQRSTKLETRLRATWKVSYLHRSVKDYLRSDRIRAQFQRYTSSLKGFDPNLSLLESYVINLKYSLRSFYVTDGDSKDQQIRKISTDVFRITSRLDHERQKYPALLRGFYQLTCHWLNESDSNIEVHTLPSLAGWRSKFLSMASYFGLWEYVEADLQQHKTLPAAHNSVSLLRYALYVGVPRQLQLSESMHVLDPNMVRVLLQAGADLNQYCEFGQSVWKAFLDQMVVRREIIFHDEKIWKNYAHILQEILSFSPRTGRCSLRISNGDFIFLESFSNVSFSKIPPEEAAALRTSLELRRSKTPSKREQEITQDLLPIPKRQQRS
jgi:hypothetical protein